MAKQMDFSKALMQLKQGKQLRRRGWNGMGQWIALQVPDIRSEMDLPYVYISTVSRTKVPWTASQTDLLAEDWEIAE